MSNYKHTDEEFIQIVKQSTSIRQVLIALNLAPLGGNYTTIHRRLKRLNIDTQHFKGQAWNKNLSVGFKRPIEDYLSNKFSITTHKLRLRLLQENIFEYKCYKCNNTEWLGKPIPLELDHINGNPQDNTLSNLILLCPNCHAFTPTHRGKNKKLKNTKT